MKSINTGSLETTLEKYLEIDNLNLKYTLFKRTTQTDGRQIFSIEISISSENGTESAFAHDITSVPSRARDIFEILHSGVVTPCTMNDVLENIL